jgi:hypothetical protein
MWRLKNVKSVVYYRNPPTDELSLEEQEKRLFDELDHIIITEESTDGKS